MRCRSMPTGRGGATRGCFLASCGRLYGRIFPRRSCATVSLKFLREVVEKVGVRLSPSPNPVQRVSPKLGHPPALPAAPSAPSGHLPRLLRSRGRTSRCSSTSSLARSAGEVARRAGGGCRSEGNGAEFGGKSLSRFGGNSKIFSRNFNDLPEKFGGNRGTGSAGVNAGV